MQRGGAYDEIHIAVWDATGAIAGQPNTLLEKFSYVSKANNAKTSQGAVNYYPQVVLEKSNYVYWGAHETAVYDISAVSYTHLTLPTKA